MAMPFYVLDRRHGIDQSSAPTDCSNAIAPPYKGDAPICRRCGSVLGLLEWLPPLKVEIEVWGAAFGDIVAAPGDDYIISERFVTLTKASKITGLAGFDPVEVVRVVHRGRAVALTPPAYYRVSVFRSCASIDFEASGVEYDGPICPVCGAAKRLKRWRRIVVDGQTWSGEDVFRPRGFPITIVSERFKSLCESHKILNACFIAADEYCYDSFPHESDVLARELLEHPLDGTVLEKVKRSGEVWRYRPKTNELAVRYPDGRAIRFHPVDGRAFWDKQ